MLAPARGERRGRGCAARASHRRRRGRACTLYRRLGSFTHVDGAGAVSFFFTGRLHGRGLPRGSYRLEARARYAGGSPGAALTAAFTITG